MTQKQCLLALLSSRSNAFSKWLPPPSVFPGGVYVLLLLPRGRGGEGSGFNHWQVCLTQASFKLLSLHWNLEQVKFCIRRLRLESPFPIALKFSCVQAPMALNSRFLEGSSFQCKAPRVETPDVGLRSFTPYGEPLQL